MKNVEIINIIKRSLALFSQQLTRQVSLSQLLHTPRERELSSTPEKSMIKF